MKVVSRKHDRVISAYANLMDLRCSRASRGGNVNIINKNSRATMQTYTITNL